MVVVVTGKLGMGGSRACAEVVSPVSPPYGHTSHVSVWVLESDVILTISQGSLILSRDFLGSEFAVPHWHIVFSLALVQCPTSKWMMIDDGMEFSVFFLSFHHCLDVCPHQMWFSDLGL